MHFILWGTIWRARGGVAETLTGQNVVVSVFPTILWQQSRVHGLVTSHVLQALLV